MLESRPCNQRPLVFIDIKPSNAFDSIKIQVGDNGAKKEEKKIKFSKENSFKNSIRQRYCLHEDHINDFQREKKRTFARW